jgi:hypothetical protein
MKNIIGLLIVLGSFNSFAAVEGDLTISGTVAPEISLSLSTNTYTTLDILAGGDHSVATATEVCNDLDGYKIYGYSVNGSQLENQANTAVKTAYSVKYDGASAVTLGQGSAAKVILKSSGALTASADYDSSIVIDVTSMPTAPAGVYQDTITLQIVAN